MNQVPIMCGCLSWSSTIGNFIPNFGMLDLHVQDFLESLLSAEEFLKFKERPFYERVKIIKQELDKADCMVINKTGFTQFFHRLDPLRVTRNQIAHGILRVGLAADENTLIQTLSLPGGLDGSEEQESRHLIFAELQAELATLNGLIEEFQRLAGFKAAGCATRPDDLKT